MAQEEIINLLEKSKVPLTSREIADELKQDHCKVCKAINIMLRYKEIQQVEINKDLAMKFYKSKRRLRLFYV